MKLEPTTTLIVDEVPFAVSALSADIQQNVAILDVWRQEELDQATALTKTRLALGKIQEVLTAQMKEHIAAQQPAAPLEAQPAVDSSAEVPKTRKPRAKKQ